MKKLKTDVSLSELKDLAHCTKKSKDNSFCLILGIAGIMIITAGIIFAALQFRAKKYDLDLLDDEDFEDDFDDEDFDEDFDNDYNPAEQNGCPCAEEAHFEKK